MGRYVLLLETPQLTWRPPCAVLLQDGKISFQEWMDFAAKSLKNMPEDKVIDFAVQELSKLTLAYRAPAAPAAVQKVCAGAE